MLCRLAKPFFCCLIAWVAFPLLSFAQQAEPATARKILTRVVPAYPELARRTNVTGTVRLDATIAPDGEVKSTEVVGGNPILIQAAIEAVRKWRFEPASQQTKERIDLKFSPH
jgi:TonB family protein